jgi:hypothetical protein
MLSKSKTARFKDIKSDPRLGPGTYDYRAEGPLRYACSSFNSKTERFKPAVKVQTPASRLPSRASPEDRLRGKLRPVCGT